MTKNVISFNELENLIKSNNDSWGILTGNGFNISCEVKTDYQSLCTGLINYFSDELSQVDIDHLKSELKHTEYNFEAWLSTKTAEDYMGKIALKAIRRQWLVEFVKACCKDRKQHNFSQSLNYFLNLFQYFFTLNVDPYFYRRCLARTQPMDTKKMPNSEGESTSSTRAQTSAGIETVFVGIEKEQVEEVKAQDALKKSFRKAKGLLPPENEKPKGINDGFSKRRNMRKEGVDPRNHNLFHLHGACHLKVIESADKAKIMKKLKSNDEQTLIGSILAEEPETNSAIFAATSEEKLQKIKENEYLKSQYEAFSKVSCRNIVIYGASLADNDKHIWDAIRKNPNIYGVYIR